MLHFQKSSASSLHRRLPALTSAYSLRQALGFPPVESCLSFGCATGEEVFSLCALFPQATVHGCDISETALSLAQSAGLNLRAEFFNSNWGEIEARGPYDIIFANAVFCYHHQSIFLDSLDADFPFPSFVDATARLVSLLRPGGLLLMQDTTYPLALTPAAGIMIPIQLPGETWSGVVEKFGPDGLKFGKRHFAGFQMAFERIREFPAPFPESFVDTAWIKCEKADPPERFRVEKTCRQALEQPTFLGSYFRDTADELSVANLINQRTLASFYRSADGVIIQEEHKCLVDSRENQTVFEEKMASVIDPANAAPVFLPEWIDTRFWEQRAGQTSWTQLQAQE
ncbi:MAG TPA: class I SAM-dependent methyltransferase [Chthoniobacterales bacterium]